MIYAAREGHLDIVKYLHMEGADASIRSKVIITIFIIFILFVLQYGSKTALDYARDKGHKEIVKYLEDPVTNFINTILSSDSYLIGTNKIRTRKTNAS